VVYFVKVFEMVIQKRITVYDEMAKELNQTYCFFLQ